jgi:hypothetical protein
MEKNVCKNLKFEECELAILRMTVDKATIKTGKQNLESDDIKKIINIIEEFLKDKELICYGGTAINNILPAKAQFYNKEIEIPDYDFFSTSPLEDAKELADIYYKHKFTNVEAKSGVHHGTYKVFVNFIPIADITLLPLEIFNSIKKDSIKVDGILYTPPNYLRMSMYLELSRPMGDTSRWEKVLKRLNLLNKYYSITDLNCDEIDLNKHTTHKTKQEKICDIVKKILENEKVVFFGGYAVSLYSKYMPKHIAKKLEEIADFEVLSNDLDKTSLQITKQLKKEGFKDVEVLKKPSVGEIVSEHYEISVDSNIIAYVYKPLACHSYNTIKINGKKIRIATIDTMLSFYLAFMYVDKPYYKHFLDRILCTSKFLFDLQQKHKVDQKGILKQFSIKCYGHQETLSEIRSIKSLQFEKLKKDKNSKEFQEWFLNYKPFDKESKKQDSKKQDSKKQDSKKHKSKKSKNDDSDSDSSDSDSESSDSDSESSDSDSESSDSDSESSDSDSESDNDNNNDNDNHHQHKHHHHNDNDDDDEKDNHIKGGKTQKNKIVKKTKKIKKSKKINKSKKTK